VSNAVLRCYPELSDGEKMTYILLKSFAYVGPETFVGEETLARARGSTVSTISRHLQKLIQVGLVKVRRRGQGRTNIWIITRIPREKLEQYMSQWRPEVDLAQNRQTKTAQNPQVKTSRSAQAEEQESREPKGKNRERPRRTASGSSSSGKDSSSTARTEPRERPDTREAALVENSARVENLAGAAVENSEELADLVVGAFNCPRQRRSIATFLEGYDTRIAQQAFESVLHRLDRGESIAKPVAYFYTVLKVMQAEHAEAEKHAERSEREKHAIAVGWARSLLRDWPEEQVRAILMDTYRQEEWICAIMAEASG